MPSRIVGTFSKVTVQPLMEGGEPFEFERRSAQIPTCKECNHRRNVVRFMGRWVCNVHFRVKNTRADESLVFPEGVEIPWSRRPDYELRELFVNRKHRRQAGHTRAFA